MHVIQLIHRKHATLDGPETIAGGFPSSSWQSIGQVGQARDIYMQMWQIIIIFVGAHYHGYGKD